MVRGRWVGLATAALLLATQAPAHADDDTGTLRVTIEDAAGQPLAGACVDVYDPVSTAPTYPNVHSQVTTGSDGVASFELPVATYSLRVADCSGKTLATRWYGGDDRRATASDVSVSGGDVDDLGSLVDPKAGTVKGAVVDADGQPYGGACVAATDTNEVYGSDEPAVTATADGTYELAGLYPRPQIIAFRDCSSDSFASYFDHATTAPQATPVAVVAGGVVASVDGVLPSGATLTGVVRDDAGAPVTTSKICIGAQGGTGNRYVYTSLGSDGSYVFRHLLPGQGGFVYAFQCYQRDPANPDLLGASASQLSLAEGATTVEDLTMRTGAVVTGVVRGADGTPLAGACVHAIGIPTTVTGSDGSYTLQPFDTGNVSVGVSDCSASPTLATSWYPHAAWPSQDTPVAVTAGQTTSGIDLTLDQQAATLTGHVLDDLGAPVAGACINVHGPGDGDGIPCTYTDSSGAFTESGLPAGTVSVQVEVTDVPSATTNYLTSVTPGIELQPGAATDTDLQVVRAGSVVGRIIDQRGLPILGVRVWAFCDHPDLGSANGQTTVTDSDGHYDITGLPIGSCYLRFTDDDGTLPFSVDSGYPLAQQHFDVSAGEVVQEPLQFVPTVTVPDPPIDVQALANDGTATVSWQPPASDGYAAITSYAVTDGDGDVLATASGDARSAVVTGLADGTDYAVDVVATNRKGDSPHSVTATFTPSAAATPSASAGSQSPGSPPPTTSPSPTAVPTSTGSRAPVAASPSRTPTASQRPVPVLPTVSTAPPLKTVTPVATATPVAATPARLALRVLRRGHLATLRLSDTGAVKGRRLALQALHGHTWVVIANLTEGSGRSYVKTARFTLPSWAGTVRLAAQVGRRTPAYTQGVRAR